MFIRWACGLKMAVKHQSKKARLFSVDGNDILKIQMLYTGFATAVRKSSFYLDCKHVCFDRYEDDSHMFTPPRRVWG